MAYKHDYDKILTRLITILKRLNEGEVLSVSELASEFNVSTKTIQRDFNERLVSFPIIQINKKWQMQDGHKIEKTQDVEEKIVLDIIEKITEGIGGRFATKSGKLLSKIKNYDYNPIYTKLNIEDISDRLSDIQLLESAIKQKLQITCQYMIDESKIDIDIKPLKIANFEGFWYLIALKDNKLRKYYLKEISNIKLTNEHFSTNDGLDWSLDNSISIWFEDKVEPFSVELYAHKGAAKYFQRRPLPSQKIIAINTDGTMEFSVKITHIMEIMPLVKYWIPHLQVLKPKSIRDEIKKDLQAYLKEIEDVDS